MEVVTFSFHLTLTFLEGYFVEGFPRIVYYVFTGSLK